MSLFMTRQNGSLYSRLRAIGIPHDILLPFFNDVDKWSRKSGEEWTVGRLKSIKNDIIRVHAGLEPTSTWIKHSGKFFRGSAGNLQKWMSNSSSSFKKGIQLLQVYSSFYSKNVTNIQEEKFLSSVFSESTEIDPSVYDVLSLGILHSGLGVLQGRLPDPKPLLLVQTSSEKRAPLPHGRSVPEVEALVDSIGFLNSTSAASIHYRRFHKLYDPVIGQLSNFYPLKRGTSYTRVRSDVFEVGRIGLIQEAGYKLRAVANPGRVFQRVLEPLGNYLYGLLKRLPWDCTFNQSAAWIPVQEALSKGRTVTCFDLSNATDLFPLAIQLKALETLLPDNQDHISLFHEVSRGSWFYPGKGYIQWKTGQPLGLYPSFASFALSHGLLLLGLLDAPFNGEFYVLGDDVVILDTRLAQKYHQLMISIGCKISESKSIVSNSIAEFGGRLITKEDVILQMKHRRISDDSFIDLAKQIGNNCLWLFPRKQRKVLEAIAPIPEFLGGLGQNPKGLPLSERLALAFSDKQPKPLLTDYTTYQVRSLYESSIFNKWSVLQDAKTFVHMLEKTTLDQRASDLTSKLGRHLVPLTYLMGKNIDTVFEDSNLHIQVIPNVDGSRKTLLDRWLTKLGFST